MDENTVREAIEELKNNIRTCKDVIVFSKDKGMKLTYERYEEKIQNYETAIEALEKQLSMKAEYEGGFSHNGFTRYRMAKCPTCDKWYSSNDEVIYCTNCGQKIDWSE